MFNDEIFSWRTITEIIRHITFVFGVALILTLIFKDYSISELWQISFSHEGFKSVFCIILLSSIPLYIVCLIIDSIDEMNIDTKLGFSYSVIKVFVSRFVYDVIYVFLVNMSTWKAYIVIFTIQVLFCLFGVIFVL